LKKLIIFFTFIGLLCGCGKETKDDVLKEFSKKIESVKSYKVTGNMEISNDEENFVYSLESYYLKDGYYKVVMVNQTNNHEQIILKSKEDIYVITPSLNKSFKFQSEWPDNSSQAYLLGNLNNDIKNDADREVIEKDDGYIIKSKVNYPNNEELTYQKIYLDKNKSVEKVEVFNKSDLVKIKVDFNKVDLKAGLDKEEFELDKYIKEESNTEKEEVNNCPSDEQTTCTEKEKEENGEVKQETEEETLNIENIIYPLYIPSNTFLTSSETIDTINGNRVILTFSGEKNFVLIEEPSMKNAEMEIVPVYGEPFMLSETIGALSANSLSWDKNNISYYLASNELTVSEMQTIANSLGNSTLVSNIK